MPERGSPPLVLCVPGLGLDHRAWRPTLRALREDDPSADGVVAPLPNCVVAPLPGYGARPTESDDLSPSVLGARLAAKRLADVPAPAVLLGHSASCQVVAGAAAFLPDRVAALVLVGPTTDPRAAAWPRIAQRWLGTSLWERPSQLPVLARTYTRTGLVWMLRAMDAARREDLRASLRRVECPVLVVRGRHDRICPEDWAEEVVATAPPGSATVTLDKGAHMVPLTHGEMLAAPLRRVVGRGTGSGWNA